MHTEGHDMGRDAADSSTPGDQFDAENPGYETTDVHSSGVAVFLAGLFGTVLIFFVFCYAMGRFINNFLQKQDGDPTRWKLEAGAVPRGGKRQDLASNTEMEQKQLQHMIVNFPQPRLDIDDGNQATADLHAREDLLLDHYTSVDGQPGTIRIPIERAMELIAQRGLPIANQASTATPSLAEAKQPEVKQPLTTGFARTGFELTTIAAREQKMNYGRAEASAHAEATPPK